MWIDITKFMIISQTQFEQIISFYNLPLSGYDELYLLTYLGANIFAYFMIILVCCVVYMFVHKLMPWNWKRKYVK